MADFLLELLSEEIPARMQAKAREDLARLFRDQIAAAGLVAGAIETYATPRRLVLIARELPVETAAVSEERRGPRADAPAQAIEGFLNSTGLGRDELEEREDKKGAKVLFAIVRKPGRKTADVLAEAVPAVVQAFSWPKSMRWGEASISTESQRWVRPLQGIVALLGEEIVGFEIAGIASGAATVGHRFHHPGAITIGSAKDYAEKLRCCHVIVDPAEREAIIRKGAEEAVSAAGLSLVPDDGLVAENAGLTEWPVPLLGRFDPAFLAVPREVIQLTMRANQKYFACIDTDGALAPSFVCVANIEAGDGGAAIVAGNEKVLAARLSDAKFFWEQDLKAGLEPFLPRLDDMLFAEGLGTLRSKAARIAELSAYLAGAAVESADPAAARRAGELAKADLASAMVGEFPELQGVMGGYYAQASDEQPEVGRAIAEQYGAEPSSAVSICVGLADRIDTLAAFFARGIKPTGSKDPYALRRAALQAIQIILDNGLRLNLRPLLSRASSLLPADETGRATPFDLDELIDFFADRLKVQQREAGVRHDLIDAVFSLGGEDDLVRLLARVRALQFFVETSEGADLLTGYKRAANILKREGWSAGETDVASVQTGEEDPFALAEDPAVADALLEYARQGGVAALSYPPEPAEAALIAALDRAEPKAREAIAAEDFEGAMAALASLRAPVDAFFDEVTVNDPDSAKREARLALLARMRDAVHRVADFSRIEG